MITAQFSCFPCWCLWWGNAVVRREWRWNIMWSAADSLLLLSSCSHLCLQNRANKCVCLLQRMAEHPPFLKIGCAERRLKIDPPLITVSEIFISRNHLQTPFTITRFLQPLPHPHSRHRDSHNQPVLTLFDSCYLYMDILCSYPSKKKKKSVCSWLAWVFFPLLCSMQL